jgi:hypothetical protein
MDMIPAIIAATPKHVLKINFDYEGSVIFDMASTLNHAARWSHSLLKYRNRAHSPDRVLLSDNQGLVNGSKCRNAAMGFTLV